MYLRQEVAVHAAALVHCCNVCTGRQTDSRHVAWAALTLMLQAATCLTVELSVENGLGTAC